MESTISLLIFENIFKIQGVFSTDPPHFQYQNGNWLLVNRSWYSKKWFIYEIHCLTDWPFFISVLKRGGAEGKNTLYLHLRWKLFVWGENVLSEVKKKLSEVIKNRMLTASFHLMVWTSSSCVRCPSLPRPLIFLGRSFWYLQQSHIVISSGKHKYWYNMHVWSSLEWTYVRVHPNVITTQFLEHPNMKWIQGKFSDFLYLRAPNLHSNE